MPEDISLSDLKNQLENLRQELETAKANAPEDKLSMVVFSGDLDRQLAAFIIANGAAAMFEKVVMFFTFWAIPALRDPKKSAKGKNFMARMFGWMLPKGARKLKLSQMNMMGMGTAMIQSLMKQKNVYSLPELIQKAAESGVQIYICQMSMDLMGFKREEMIDYPHICECGVAKFLQEAGSSKVSLFI